MGDVLDKRVFQRSEMPPGKSLIFGYVLVARPGATPASTCAQNCLCRLPRRVSPSAWGTWGVPRLGSPWARGWCWSWVGGRRTEGRKTRTVPPVGQCSGPWISHSNTKHQTHSGCETSAYWLQYSLSFLPKVCPIPVPARRFPGASNRRCHPCPWPHGRPSPERGVDCQALGPKHSLARCKRWSNCSVTYVRG